MDQSESLKMDGIMRSVQEHRGELLPLDLQLLIISVVSVSIMKMTTVQAKDVDNDYKDYGRI